MKKTLSNILMVIVALGAIFYPLISGIVNLTNFEDIHKENIYAAGKILEIEHSINGLIPTGKEHFYVGFSENGTFLIRASKNWADKNFDSDGFAKNDEGFEIVGLAKKISDYEIEKEIAANLDKMVINDLPIGRNMFLDVNYKVDAIKRIISGVLLMITGILGIGCFVSERIRNNKLLVIISIVSFLAGAVLLINILM